MSESTPHASEQAIHEALMQWMEARRGAEPTLALAFHAPLGEARDALAAMRLQSLGAKPGVPDLMLPVPRGPYLGLALEIKAPGNRPTLAQRRWIEALDAVGWMATWAAGLDACIAVVEGYLAFSLRDAEHLARRRCVFADLPRVPARRASRRDRRWRA